MPKEIGFPARHLASEEVVVAAPLSFAGSAARIWKITRAAPDGWGHVGLAVTAVTLVALAWIVVLAWYVLWSVWLVPYRLVRRGARKRRREALMHRETLAAIEMGRSSQGRRS